MKKQLIPYAGSGKPYPVPVNPKDELPPIQKPTFFVSRPMNVLEAEFINQLSAIERQIAVLKRRKSKLESKLAQFDRYRRRVTYHE